MKRTLLFGFVLLLMVLPVVAQDTTTIEAKNDDISENLDLEAVASVFGEAEDLEDFEKRLNDPEAQLTNLDLNSDGEVDYLRAMETVKGETHHVAIQAVVGEDQFQDVATIEVEKDSSGETQVQVVGDVYMYGPSYICEPIYVRPPPIFVIFWTPFYNPWRSPCYWGFYPPYYRPWRPYPTRTYRTNVNVNINVNNTYNYTSVRKSKTSVELQQKNRRNDFEKKNPDTTFAKRNPGVENRQQLGKETKNSGKPDQKDMRSGENSTGQKVQDDWKPAAERDVAGKAAEASSAERKKSGVPDVAPAPEKKPNAAPKSVKPSQTKPKKPKKKKP